MSNLNRFLFIVVGIAFVGVLGYALRPDAAPTAAPAAPAAQPQAVTPVATPVTTTKPAGTGQTTTTLANRLVVAAHQQPGASILVSSVTLTAPGFIVIHEAINDRDSIGPGKILAVGPLLPKGVTSGVNVKIPTSPNEQYFVTIHADNGNKVFSAPEDPIAHMSSGAALQAQVVTDLSVTSSAKSVYVSIKASSFSPTSITVNKKDIVVFQNDDIYPHTVTAKAFGGQHVVAIGKSYALDTSTLAPGTYTYSCDYHNFKGTLIVK